MLWPTIGCSIVTAGLWVARQELPDSLSPYTDLIALALIILMLIWLVRRALAHGRRATLRRLATDLVNDLDSPPAEPATQDHR
jgi:ABC-type nickel/cobalt efflux system permease component RcnA